MDNSIDITIINNPSEKLMKFVETLRNQKISQIEKMRSQNIPSLKVKI